MLSFDLDSYLERLAFRRPATTEMGLADLQEAQLRAIAFENIMPLTGCVPDLEPASLADKIIAQRRGGYCFELNGLFLEALNALGFAVAPVLARVRRDPAQGGIRSHLCFVVTIGQREWLADTGFGGPGARRALPIEFGRVEEQGCDSYRIEGDANTGETLLMKRGAEGEWAPLYGFAHERVQPCDVESANFLCARWEHAPFSANLMLNRLTARGRVSARNTSVTEIRDGVRTTRTLADRGDLARLLADVFALSVSPADVTVVAEKLGLEGAAAAE